MKNLAKEQEELACQMDILKMEKDKIVSDTAKIKQGQLEHEANLRDYSRKINIYDKLLRTYADKALEFAGKSNRNEPVPSPLHQ